MSVSDAMNEERLGLDDLKALSPQARTALLGPIFEHSAWVADAICEQTFDSLTALHAAMMGVLDDASDERRLAFLRGHPRLSRRSPAEPLTAASTLEQHALGIGQLGTAVGERLDAMNAAYEARFGFPFILAVRRAAPSTLMAAFERRLDAPVEAERREAIGEIGAITWMRLLERIRPAPTGSLSTHVLDTVRAVPAAGLGVELWQPGASETPLLAFETNGNGASDRHLLGGGKLQAGTYEWRYDTSTYFARHGYGTVARSFLDTVTVSFSVWNPEDHFHVPLLLTPGSYTTYRGS